MSNNVNEVEFDFAKSNFEIEIDVSPVAGKTKLVAAKMRKPSHEELIERERSAIYEVKQVSATESENTNEEVGPNAKLFDAIATELRGYRLLGEAKEQSKDFRVPPKELLACIPKNHKSTFIETMYSSVTKFVDEDEDVVLGGEVTLPVELTIGTESNPFAVIRFELPEPAEKELEKFLRKANQLRHVTGMRRHVRIVTNLRATIDFFVELMSRPGASVSPNGKVNGESFSDATDKRAWANQVDPVYMSAIIGTALSKYNARRQD